MKHSDQTKRDQQARDIFLRAVEIPLPEARAAYLEGACRNDDSLRSRVEALIASHQEDTFLESAAVDGLPTLLDETPVSEGPGAQVDRYKLLQKLGEGGFGVVYMAEQKEPVKRRVALKIIKLGMDTRQVVARFEAERQALAMMDHPNIAKVLDAGSTETGRPYFVMELVKGVPITKYCDDNNLTTRERLELFIPVCQAIQHAHQKGIIHRDIKPSNVMITLHDGVPVPKVIDFGIAKATQQELTEKTLFTHYSQFIGTPAYMSPEQAEMSGLDIDTRSDIYSLGVLLYELLVGRTPLDAKELASGDYDEIRRRIREEEAPRPSTRFSTLDGVERTAVAKHRRIGSDQLSGELRGDLDWIVLKALEKDRTRRYETTNAFVLDIQRYLKDEPVTAVAPSRGYLFKKYVRRNKAPLAVAATIAGLMIAGIAASTILAINASRARYSAEEARSDALEQKRQAQENELEAQRQREVALEQEALAQRLQQEAESKERQQRLSAYAADMSLAHGYLNENKRTEVKRILDRWAGKENEGVRGVYWQHLQKVIEDDKSRTLPHGTMVRSLSLSADGTRLASQTLSGRVRLFSVSEESLVEADDEKPLWEYGGGLLSHGAQDGSVALSPDGRLLASDQQGTLEVRDTDTGELVFEQADVVAPVAFSPDSKTLVGVTETGVRRWSTSDWKELGHIGDRSTFDTTRASALTFVPDGKRLLLSPSRFGSKLIIYNVETDTIEGELNGLDRPAVISTDGTTVAAGGWNGQVAVWNLGRRELLATFKAHTSIVLGVALSPDGKTLATGGNDGVIKLWDTATFEVSGNLKGHRGQVWNLKFSRDGRYLASAGMDQSVKVWDWQTVAPEPRDPARADAAPVAGGRLAADDASRRDPPTTHVVMPGDSIQTVIDKANAGDIINLAAGVHTIEERINVRKPLTISGAPTGANDPASPTVVKGVAGLEALMWIETDAVEPLLLEGLQMESFASGILHRSGNFTLRKSRVTTRSTLEFQSVINLGAAGAGGLPTDSVIIDDCTLTADYAGPTIEGTPPDIDVILANPGTRYAQIAVTNCRIENRIANIIANGIETRATSALVTITANELHCLGIGIVLPNHVGAVEIRDNAIAAAFAGISVGSDTQERSYITGNRITVEDAGGELYPFFVRNYIDAQDSACIAIGRTSAGVTAGFFLQKVIGLAANFTVEGNTLVGNPKYGIAMNDSADPENYGPYTPNRSHDNMITRNDFADLRAEQDIILGPSTLGNRIFGNVGLKTVFKVAGDRDRNHVSLSTESAGRYVADEITSPSLKGNLLGDPATRPVWVWLPPGYGSSPEKRYPVIYLLHGFTGDHNSFKHGPMLQLDIDEMASSLIADGQMSETIVIMPHAANAYGGSLYWSNPVIGDYRSYIARDLVAHIDANYRTIPDRDHRGIAGNSMGANGALSLAMEYPDTFGAVAAMSPSADFAAAPTALDEFVERQPTSIGRPTIVHNSAELSALLTGGNVWVNLLYARAAAYSPNPDKPPYYVDLPLQYPAKTVVSEVWAKWLEQDLVSQIERQGRVLKNTAIFIDVGTGPVTIMPETHDIAHLRAALDAEGLAYTFVESPGDHLSHLRSRTMEALKFLSSPER